MDFGLAFVPFTPGSSNSFTFRLILTLYEACGILDMIRGRKRKIANGWYIGNYP